MTCECAFIPGYDAPGVPNQYLRRLFGRGTTTMLLNESKVVRCNVGVLVEIDPETGEETRTPTPQPGVVLKVKFSSNLGEDATLWLEAVIPQFNPGVYDPDNSPDDNEHWLGTIDQDDMNLIPVGVKAWVEIGREIDGDWHRDEACAFDTSVMA